MYADHTSHRHGFEAPVARALRAVVAFGVVTVLGAGALFVTLLDGETTSRGTGTTYGARLALGAGTASAYVTLDRGKPVEFGLALRETSHADSLAEPGAASDGSSSRSTH